MKKDISLAIYATVLFGLAITAAASWLQFGLVRTPEPSFWNCLTLLPVGQEYLFHFGGIILGCSTSILASLRRTASIVFLEALGLLIVAYFAATYAASAGAAIDPISLGNLILVLSFAAIFLVWILRHDLKRLENSGTLK